MEKYEFYDKERVNKTVARNLYNAGFEVFFIPCKCDPSNPFYRLGIWENKLLWGQYDTFDKLCNAFEYYNCNPETGKYISFYVKKSGFIHFEFADGSNPFYFQGTILECAKILKKWAKNWNCELLKPGFYRLEMKEK